MGNTENAFPKRV